MSYPAQQSKKNDRQAEFSEIAYVCIFMYLYVSVLYVSGASM